MTVPEEDRHFADPDGTAPIRRCEKCGNDTFRLADGTYFLWSECVKCHHVEEAASG